MRKKKKKRKSQERERERALARPEKILEAREKPIDRGGRREVRKAMRKDL